MQKLYHTPSVKVKGAELYTRDGKSDIKIMNEKFITDRPHVLNYPLWVERSNMWYIVVDGKVFEKTKTLKQSQVLVQYILNNDII